MITSPYKTKKERGGYSAIVYEDGDLYVAEDEEGNTIIESTDAATVIQKAIDDYGYYGKVLVKPAVTLTSPIKLLNATLKVEFLGKISLATGINGIEFGDATHDASGCEVKLVMIDGVDKSSKGLVFINTSISVVNYILITKCDIGMYFDAALGGTGAYENIVEGALISDCASAGVRFSSANKIMEGNHFKGSIYSSAIGFDTISGGESALQTWVGSIDCTDFPGVGRDIQDKTGRQLFLCDYIGRDKSEIRENSIITNTFGAFWGEDNSDVLELRGGTIDAMNIGFTPLLIWDFNRDSTGDWTKEGCTMGTPSKSVTRITQSGAAGNWISRDIEVDGGKAQYIAIRYRYISGTGMATGQVFWGTSGHGVSESYKRLWYNVLDGEWHTFFLDMNNLTAGGTDWIDNVITSIRFDMIKPGEDSVLDIDYIAIGTRAYPSIYNFDDGLLTPATASAQGNKGDIRWDAGHIYICTATDTWKRVAIGTW